MSRMRSPVTPRAQRTIEQLNAVQRELAVLHEMKMPDLWKVWDLHFASRPVHPNRKYLTSRLSYRIQELAFGTLPQSTRERLVDYGQNLSKIKTNTPAKAVAMPGATLVREFEGSFSSVTQQINSSTSNGRLMLNMLLSFAQFEREVSDRVFICELLVQ